MPTRAHDDTMPNMTSQHLTGVNADLAAGVTIGTVFSGYFNSDAAAEAFVNIGIVPLCRTLAAEVHFADFGGGDGFLAQVVRDCLTAHERLAKGLVVDMNPSYLTVAKRRGFLTATACLDEVKTQPLDLVIARAILHYNPLTTQQAILSNVYRNLKPGGYFVHSPSSGDKGNCGLRTEIAALISLGRTNGDGSVHFIVPETYVEMAAKAGFAETTLVGFAPNNSWTLSEMFARFNPVPAIENTAYLARKWRFMQEAMALIEKYRRETDVQGVELLKDDARISYQYPIFVSRKA